MSKNPSPRRIIRLLVAFAVLAWAVYSWFIGDWGTLQSLGTGAIIGLAVMVVIYPFNLKKILITVFSSYSHRPALPAESPHLDLPELERLTAEWQSLGFVQRGDFEGHSSNPALGTSFSRLFEHQSQGVIAEVMQQFTPTKTLPINSVLQSFWGQREPVLHQALNLTQTAEAVPPLAAPTSRAPQSEEPLTDNLDLWVLATHNRAPNRYFRVMRHPRALGARLEANTTPAQMWQFHRERAALVEARLSSTALCGDLPTLLRAHGQVINVFTVRRLRATPAWKLALYSFNRKPSPPIYDGELAPLT